MRSGNEDLTVMLRAAEHLRHSADAIREAGGIARDVGDLDRAVVYIRRVLLILERRVAKIDEHAWPKVWSGEIPTFHVKARGGPFKNAGADLDGCHLVFECPVCEAKNVHGGTLGRKGFNDGHRLSHCPCWPNGYYIKEV